MHSHALHVFLLHMPDFLGYPDAIALARNRPAVVESGLALKKAGNTVMERIGGRAVHPVNVRLGGFYSVPGRTDLEPVIEMLRRAHDHALDTVRLVAGFGFPDVEYDHELLALTHPHRYPIENGAVGLSAGPGFAAAEFGDHVATTQVAHSTAAHTALDGGRYLTGPLARYSLNSDRLTTVARQAAAAAGLGPACRNPFRSIVIRAVEIVYAIEEALRIIDEYEPPSRLFVDVPVRAGTGYGVSEAPRGLLYHRSDFDGDGLVSALPRWCHPAQNQAAIEHEMAQVVSGNQALDDAALTDLCERSIRNHDPCISWAMHFLTVDVERH